VFHPSKEVVAVKVGLDVNADVVLDGGSKNSR